MVAKMTGLSTHTLRAWEKRYGAVLPERTEAGGRLYTDVHVQRLRLLRDLVDAGHGIREVAALGDPELAQLRSAAPGQTAADLPPLRPVDAFLSAVEGLDVAAAESVLARASVGLAALPFLLEVVAPALREVGQRWADGRLRIAHERVATGAARALLFSLVRLYPPRAGLPAVVVAAPRGERHELGALMVAMLAAMTGYTVLFLGADVPEAEIAFVASERAAGLVLLSVVNLPPVEMRQVARTLDKTLPAGARIIIGGCAASPVAKTRVEHLADLAALDAILRSALP